MRLIKIWPLVINLFIFSCSVQQHTNRVERVWLKANSFNNALHTVQLDENSTEYNEASLKQSFLTASTASTFLRGELQSAKIRELSGITPVLGEPNKYWAINDSGNRPQIFAIDANGRHLAEIDLAASNRDWEDLASYSYNGDNWIAVADTGDNVEVRSFSSIYIFKQPDLNQLPSSLQPVQRIDFSYEDGPRNVESIAVSVAEAKIYLIAKDSSKPGIYTLPLAAAHDQSQGTGNNPIAVKAGQLGKLAATQDDVWWERLFAAGVLYEATAADISADGRTAVVANYRHVYLFKRQANETWASALGRTPQILSSHRMRQSEAVAFSADSNEVIVSSEGINAPVLAIRPAYSSGTTGVLQ